MYLIFYLVKKLHISKQLTFTLLCSTAFLYNANGLLLITIIKSLYFSMTVLLYFTFPVGPPYATPVKDLLWIQN